MELVDSLLRLQGRARPFPHQSLTLGFSRLTFLVPLQGSEVPTYAMP